MLKELKRQPHRVVGLLAVKNDGLVTLKTEKGHIESIVVHAVRSSDRYTNGSFLMDTAETGEVNEVWYESVEEDDNNNDNPPEGNIENENDDEKFIGDQTKLF